MGMIKNVIATKFYLVVIIGILFLIISVSSIGFSAFNLARRVFFTEPEIQGVTVDVLDDTIIDIFQLATLEIESRNSSVLTLIPGGLINPGTVTVILEYDSTVMFGVRDAQAIQMRRIGDIVFVESSSIIIEILSSSVRNFQRTHTFNSNPFVRLTPAVIDQIFEAQSAYESTAAQRLNNERNIESARRNFVSKFEAIHRGIGLTVIWE